MPISIERDPDREFAVFRHVGAVFDDELLGFYRDFFDEPEADVYVNLFIDLGQTESAGRSSGALRSLAELLEAKYADDPVQRRIAVVAPTDNSFALARMYEALSDRVPWEFRVFRDDDAARAWLGIGGEG